MPLERSLSPSPQITRCVPIGPVGLGLEILPTDCLQTLSLCHMINEKQPHFFCIPQLMAQLIIMFSRWTMRRLEEERILERSQSKRLHLMTVALFMPRDIDSQVFPIQRRMWERRFLKLVTPMSEMHFYIF